MRAIRSGAGMKGASSRIRSAPPLRTASIPICKAAPKPAGSERFATSRPPGAQITSRAPVFTSSPPILGATSAAVLPGSASFTTDTWALGGMAARAASRRAG